MPDANNYLQQKRLLPSELVYKDYELLDAWVLERSFIMANVTNAKVLDKNKQLAAAIVRGEIDEKTAFNKLTVFYQEMGYKAPAGLEGTIKDLSTEKRMKATIRMNVEMAKGWQSKQGLTGNMAKPGLEFFRARHANEPRDWAAKWQQAGEKVGWVGASSTAMVALADSPIWVALSDFGQPYPPFAWGSKMGLKSVRLSRCIELGLIADPKSQDPVTAAKGKAQLRDVRDQGMRSLNDDVAFKAQLQDKAITQELESKLKGLATLEGDTIRMTDVNGTRPYRWDEIGEVITTPNQAGVELRQAKAWSEWIHDNRVFNMPKNSDIKPHVPRLENLDMKADLVNGAERIIKEDSSSGVELRRGLNIKGRARARFLRNVKKAGYSAQEGKVCESWSSQANIADEFGAGGVVLICKSYKSRKRIDGLYKALDLKMKNPKHPESREGESIFMGYVGFSYVRHWNQNGIVYIEVEER